VTSGPILKVVSVRQIGCTGEIFIHKSMDREKVVERLHNLAYSLELGQITSIHFLNQM
jgi:hypothetical protein